MGFYPGYGLTGCGHHGGHDLNPLLKRLFGCPLRSWQYNFSQTGNRVHRTGCSHRFRRPVSRPSPTAARPAPFVQRARGSRPVPVAKPVRRPFRDRCGKGFEVRQPAGGRYPGTRSTCPGATGHSRLRSATSRTQCQPLGSISGPQSRREPEPPCLHDLRPDRGHTGPGLQELEPDSCRLPFLFRGNPSSS